MLQDRWTSSYFVFVFHYTHFSCFSSNFSKVNVFFFPKPGLVIQLQHNLHSHLHALVVHRGICAFLLATKSFCQNLGVHNIHNDLQVAVGAVEFNPKLNVCLFPT